MICVMACAFMVVAGGCTPKSTRVQDAAATPASVPSGGFMLATKTRASLPNNTASIILAAGSIWVPAGTIPEGEQYKKQGGVLMVNSWSTMGWETRNQEAYLVVKDDTLVGIYLPVDDKFVPVKEPVALKKGNP